MQHTRIALIAALFVPVMLTAQRGGGGGMGGSKRPDMNAVAPKTGPSGPTISPKDFENASVFKLFRDKKKDMKLTDAQLVAMKESDAKLKEANKTRFVIMDSLKRDAKPRTSGTPSADDEAILVMARESLRGVVADIRNSYDTAAKDAVSSLDESQKPAAEKLMEKYHEEMQDMLRDKLGGRGGAQGGAPGGGRGGRPPSF